MSSAAPCAPRLIYCPIELLRQDVALAEDVCAGRFTHAGATVTIVGQPDWTRMDLHPDREWWIEWSKFYYTLDLAFAYTATGERRFLDRWQELVGSWAANVPADFGPTDAIGRRIQNWIYSWAALARAESFEGLDPDVQNAVVSSILKQTDHLRANLTPERNHRTLELYALFVVGLALPDVDRDGGLLRFAWSELHSNLLDDIRVDGVHREHSTHYHMIALRSFVSARENARRFGLQIPETYDQRLAAAVEFAMHCHRPDGTIPALSDSDSGDYRDCLGLAADLLDRPDVAFVASNGRRGRPPVQRSADFLEAGYYVQRSSWSQLPEHQAAMRHLVFDCGPIGDGGHGHYDALSIDVWAGRHLIVDPGRYTYAEGEPDWRHWFKGTAAHNTVCVDGRDQAPYFAGKPKGARARTRLLSRISRPGLDVVGGEVTSPVYDAVHRRHVFFLNEEYWVVVDRLDARTPHDYDLRLHLAPEATSYAEVHDRRVIAPGMVLIIGGPGSISIEEGWVSREYGIKETAPVVSARVAQRQSALFATAIIPRADDDLSIWPEMSVQLGGDDLVLSIIGLGPRHDRTDSLAWTDDDGGRAEAAVYTLGVNR
jgi:heparinase II/III-like protein